MVTAEYIVLWGYQSALDGEWHLWYEVDDRLLTLCDDGDEPRAIPSTDGPNCRECIELYGSSWSLKGSRLRIEHGFGGNGRTHEQSADMVATLPTMAAGRA